ncbi:MAG: chromosome segregation protein SMC [Candidatus Promineifilaceae bacterium]
MRLKRLSLHGYKTFASKYEFEFDRGLTAIVGPNGSGKSNIADAIRWVLGEQSFSTLRGKRTTDMIFAGSQQRPRAGMAQAVLTLDNSDGWLPLDFSEIAIGRRAYRSGDNEYLINGQKVRLRDVSEALASSGLAERNYTIIGQGLIDQALSLRAEERRALFEEAAGVSQYKVRRAETLRRLEESHHNLERVHDILSEIRPRLSSLKRQAERAQNFERVAADLRHHLRIWYGYQWQQAKRRLRGGRAEFDAARAGWEEGRRQQREIQEQLDEARRDLGRLQRGLQERLDRRDRLRDEAGRLQREVAILSERQAQFRRQLAEYQTEIPGLEERRSVAQLELDLALTDLETAEAELSSRQAAVMAFEAAHLDSRQQLEAAEVALARSAADQQALSGQLGLALGQQQEVQHLLERQRQGDAYSEALAQAAAEVHRRSQAHDRLKTELAVAAAERLRAAEQRQAAGAELQSREEARRQSERTLSQIQAELAKLRAKAEVLEATLAGESGREPRIAGWAPFFELVTIPSAHRVAIEAALGAKVVTLVAPSGRPSLAALVASLHGRQRATAADLGAVRPAARPAVPAVEGVLGWAADQVTFGDERLRPLVEALLGQILLVTDAQAALRAARSLPAGAMAASADGLVSYAGGVVETAGPPSELGLLARQEELERLLGELKQLERAQADALAGLKRLEDDLGIRLSAAATRAEAEDQLADREASLAAEAGVARIALEQARQQAAALAGQQAAGREEIERLRARLLALENTIERNGAELAQAESQQEAAQARLAALRSQDARPQLEALQQQQAAAETIRAGRQAVIDSRRATLSQFDERLRRLHGRIAELEALSQPAELGGQQAELERVAAELEALEASLEPQRARSAAGRERIRALEEALADHMRRSHDLETAYSQARIELSQFESQLDSLRERVIADLGLVTFPYGEDELGQSPLPIAEVVEDLPVVNELPEDIEATIQRIRGQVHRLGGINPEAPAEYQETQARHDFLSQQLEDLNQTEAQLRQIVAELDKKTSLAFAETVERVNVAFSEVFVRLFGGGSAQLLLSDPEDLTSSGVEIVARLPNRREQGLGLLSGGERSLTAAALVFALLKVAPTPFCVLDEVDAMLDEANVNRFRELLTELSARTQFVVITHNRGTVQVAETVYGISMGADSTSQVISLRPEEFVTAAA